MVAKLVLAAWGMIRQKAMTNCVMGLEPGSCRKYFEPIFKREFVWSTDAQLSSQF